MAAPAGENDGASFAAELQRGDRARAEAALQTLCTELRGGGGTAESPLLSGYVQASPLCAELFELWEGGHDAGESHRLMFLVMEVLTAVLAGRFERTARTIRTRPGVAGRLLAERLQAMIRTMSTEKDQQLRIVLRVLAGIASQSLALAAQLHRSFNFTNESFLRLPARRSLVKSKKDGSGDREYEDVRACCVRLALSFLRWKDAALTTAVLGVRGFLGPILAGLKDDNPQQASAFLRDFHDYVARPRQIPRFAKLQFFNGFALKHFSALLGSGSSDVVASAKQLLIDVCTNTYLFRAQQHWLLMDACLELRPLREPQQEFIGAVLKAHPSLQVMYCSRLTVNMYPRLAMDFFLNASFLIGLLQLDLSGLNAAVDNALAGREDATMEMRSALMLQAVAPPAAQRSLLTHALLHADRRVLLAGLRLLTALLGRVGRAFTSSGVQDFEFRQQVLRRMPDLGTLLLVWKKLLNADGTAAVLQTQPAKAQKVGKRKRVGSDPMEAEAHEGSDAGANEDDEGPEKIDDARVAALLGAHVNNFEAHAVFAEWCVATRSYCEVLPESLLDVKFDWSKLFSPVASPLLRSGNGEVLPPGVMENVRQCALCVEAAFRASGRSQGVQLSKPQLSWLENLLRVRVSAILRGSAAAGGSEQEAAEVARACEGVLRGCLRPFAAFGDEEDAEVSVWLDHLVRQPKCVNFFCCVLQAVSSKPGAMAGSFQDALDSTGADNAERVCAESMAAGYANPSLFFFAAVNQLARTDPQAAVSDIGCARLVKGVGCQLAALLPQTTRQMAALVQSLGPWGGSSPVACSEDASAERGHEGVRQVLLGRLAKAIECRPRTQMVTDSSGTRKRRRVEPNDGGTQVSVERCKKVVAKAIESLPVGGIEEQEAAADGQLEPALEKSWRKVRQAIEQRSARGHCGAYALLDGILTCARMKDDMQTVYWYMVMLIELAPAIASAASPVCAAVISHPLWAELVDMCARNAGGAVGFDFSGALALASYFLCHLLVLHCRDAPQVAKRPVEEVKRFCATRILPLWRLASFEEDIRQKLGLPVCVGAGIGAAKLEFLSDLLGNVAKGLVAVCSQCSMLEELALVELPAASESVQFAMVEALVCGGGSESPLMLLPAQRRVELLELLVAAVHDGRRPGAEGVLRRVVAVDREAALHFVVTTKLENFWKGNRKSGASQPLRRDLMPLLAQACRVNVALRADLVRRLDWRSCEPSTTLLLATILAPLERALPFLSDEAVSDLEPAQLQPLPPQPQLLRLLALHPSPALGQLLQKAAEAEAGIEGRVVALKLAETSASKPKLERALVRFLKSSSKRGGAPSAPQQLSADIVLISGALLKLQDPSLAVLEQLRPICEAAVEASEAAGKAAARLLGVLLALMGEGPPEAWQTQVATRLLTIRDGDSIPQWLLCHAVRWWQHFDAQSPAIRDFVGRVRNEYGASLSWADRRRRQILMSDAARDTFIAVASAPSGVAATGQSSDPWGIRRWCGTLPMWGDAAWNWVLDAERVQATTGNFWYDRPLADPVPWAHRQRRRPALGGVASGNRTTPFSSQAQAYDVGYVVPLIAGQLRALWAEHGEESGESRHYVGPVMSSLMSGGVVELLVMACACSDASIRAAAMESLSVVLALASLWKEVLLIAPGEENTSKVRNPFRELPHLVFLLRHLRNTFEPPEAEGGIPAALSTLSASFLSACVSVLQKPQHFLYIKIGAYVLRGVVPDPSDVPLFVKLLFSDDVRSGHEARLWLFRVVRRSLCAWQPEDVQPEKGAGDEADEEEDQAEQPDEKRARVEEDAGDIEDAQFVGANTKGNNTQGRATRVALERRNVIPWLMSFADSRELTDFGVWCEVVACLYAALVRAPKAATTTAVAGATRRFAVAEWIVGQVSRRWPGTVAWQQRVQSLEVLTRLLHGLLCSGPWSQSGRATAPEQLALGSALESLVSGWAGAVRQGSNGPEREAHPPIVTFWDSALGLAALTCNDAKSSDYTMTGTAVATQLGGALRRLSELARASACGDADGDVDHSLCGLLVARTGPEVVFAQAIALLEVCPLSVVLHDIVASCVRRGAEAAGATGGDLFELAPATQVGIARAIGQVFRALRDGGSPTGGHLRSSITSLLRLFVGLHLCPRVAWRVYLFASASLLTLNPGAAPGGIQQLAGGSLPSPESFVNSGLPEDETEEDAEEATRLLRASEALGVLLRDSGNARA